MGDHGFSTISYAVTFLFGGCCTNAWTLERLLKDNASVGSALTFCQMVFITLLNASECIQWKPYPRLKPRVVPLKEWAIQVVILTSMSLLNNWAFAFQVPMSLQIVFRSAGLGISMVLGWLFLQKRYSILQIASVIIVTTGVIVATVSRPSASPHTRVAEKESITTQPEVNVYRYLIGIGMLFVGTILTSTLGMLQEQTYRVYGGDSWREGMFYTHLMSLPVFFAFFDDVKRGLRSLSTNSTETPFLIRLPEHFTLGVPPMVVTLFVNVFSQSACVSGAYQLGAAVSAVSLNLVLTARKALSLCISVWYFGQGLNAGLGYGAGMVLFGTILYSWASSEEVKKKKGSSNLKKSSSPSPSRKKLKNITMTNGNGHGHLNGLRRRTVKE